MSRLLAVSGGVDSMVLFHKFKESDVVVVHINHNTRGEENTLEEELISKECQKYNIKFLRYDFFYDGVGNFHKKAREYRYTIFLDILKKEGLKEILTGHHFDDQVENILMNPQKVGSKLIKNNEEMYGAIIKRPLLNMTKEQIYDYAKENKIPFLEDSSNKTLKYFRNKIRDEIKEYSYPKKRKIVDKELLRVKNLEKIKSELKAKKVVLDTDLKSIEHIYIFLKEKGVTKNISLNKLNNVFTFLKSKKNGKIQVSKNCFLENSYNKVSLIYEDYLKIINIQKLKEGINEFNGLIFNNNYIGYVKVFESGDRIKIKGGHKKVSRIFIDQKIPKRLRKIWPIIINEEGHILKVLKKEEVSIKE